jgi:hypothetical protein
MNKSFLSSIAVSVAIGSGVLLATLDAGRASACPFAKGKGIFDSSNPIGLDLNKLPLAVAGISAIAATVVGVHLYRSPKTNPSAIGEEISIPSTFPIPIPPEALTSAVDAEAVETTKLS